MDELYRNLGHKLRVAMVDARMTQSELAEKTGVAVNTVSRHMRGRPMTVASLYAYCDALGIKADDLLPRLDSNQEPTGWSIGGGAAA